MLIENRTVIVTGGGSGLGEATARHFAKAGARVAIFDFDAARGEAVAEEIGGRAFQVDVADAGAVESAVAQVVETLGAPRVAVNCAGIAGAARVVGREGKLAIDLFERTIKVNLFGTYNVMSHAARAMSELEPEGEERGVIVNTASIAFEDGQLGQTAYAASKGAIASLCLPAARDLAKLGIRVAAIAPGLFNTPMMQGLPEETTAAITANIPFPARLGDPGEYAHLAEHIVRNAYINGTTIRLDGSVRLPPR
ncbi:SDR family oxidoreductase [Roseivivax sp. GX 12232]|uniref:SDR family NAD(P)-dependent oxidoreductase n=1 Tax=Roseivivax sp. GX 12232 TaxID=2900547 RepID=UPI001E653624|nr:SDR family NAD(P)-dependent oxidoreductase [Roseivivax sp. GX 12232]MCE0504199.1 SDR family oxidoreductase [Roseivivax sp. GX 12232]